MVHIRKEENGIDLLKMSYEFYLCNFDPKRFIVTTVESSASD